MNALRNLTTRWAESYCAGGRGSNDQFGLNNSQVMNAQILEGKKGMEARIYTYHFIVLKFLL